MMCSIRAFARHCESTACIQIEVLKIRSAVGFRVGLALGASDGENVGGVDGTADGLDEGATLGATLGANVGVGVGDIFFVRFIPLNKRNERSRS